MRRKTKLASKWKCFSHTPSNKAERCSTLLWSATVVWGHVLIQYFVWTCQKLSFRPSKICLEEMQEWCQQLVTFYNIRQTWPGNSYISTHPHRRPACGTNLQIHTYCCVCLIDFETLNSHKHHWNLTSVGGFWFFFAEWVSGPDGQTVTLPDGWMWAGKKLEPGPWNEWLNIKTWKNDLTATRRDHFWDLLMILCG